MVGGLEPLALFSHSVGNVIIHWGVAPFSGAGPSTDPADLAPSQEVENQRNGGALDGGDMV